MEQAQGDAFKQDLYEEGYEKCDCCGLKGWPHAQLKWKSEDPVGNTDVYCDACYWEFRRTEFAEEAVIQAIKLARLDELFTLSELQRAMAGVCGVEPEWFAKYLEEGTSTSIQRRTEDEMIAVYGPDVVSKAS